MLNIFLSPANIKAAIATVIDPRLVSVRKGNPSPKISFVGDAGVLSAFAKKDELAALGLELTFFGQRDENDEVVVPCWVQARIRR